MNYLKGRLELIEARKDEIASCNSKVVEYSTKIMEQCQRYLMTHNNSAEVKRFINLIMGYTSTIITNATTNSITVLNIEDYMKEVWECIAEMEEKK
jgi:hypothetical protein